MVADGGVSPEEMEDAMAEVLRKRVLEGQWVSDASLRQKMAKRAAIRRLSN